MRLAIVPTLIDDLARLYDAGLDDAAYGGLFEMGSYTSVADVPPGRDALEGLSGHGFAQAVRSAGVSGVVAVHPGAAIDEVHAWLGQGCAVSFVFTDGVAELMPLALIAGFGLPGLGPLPACLRGDVWATWLALAGADVSFGRNLLAEPDGSGSEPSEETVLKRLKQLYGDV